MSDAGPLRVALWGARHIHLQDHLDAVAAHPCAALAGVTEEPARAPEGDVDAVVLDGFTADHAAQLRLLDPGTPVFVEKPLALDAAGAAEVAALLAGRVHGTGLYLHLVPAVAAWLTAARTARHVDLAFGHDFRVSGGFAGDLTWMVDPAAGGSGNFADLGIHLTALLHRLWPGVTLADASVELEDAPDGLSDGGGRAHLTFDDGRTATLEVSALRRRPLTLHGAAGGVEWEVSGGRLLRAGGLALDGPAPDAAMAAGDFLDRLTHRGPRADVAAEDDPARPATAAETLQAQQDVELILATAR